MYHVLDRQMSSVFLSNASCDYQVLDRKHFVSILNLDFKD